MSYSEDVAKVVRDQLERFVTLNNFQLAGHLENLGFWLSEARHALDVIDRYQERFRKLKAGQDAYVSAHNTVVASPSDPDIANPPSALRRLPDSNLRDARRAVTDATYHFLIRLWKARLLPKAQVRLICQELDIGIEPSDLRD